MERKFILAGLGGQGVVFLTRLLAQAGLAMGYSVMVSETHGMSQRGGSVISHLKLGGSEAPLIRRGTADALLALEADEAVRNLSFVRRGGAVFANAEDGLRPEAARLLEQMEIPVLTVPASRLAQEMGAVAVTNVILAGFAIAHPALSLTKEALEQAIRQIARRGLDLNLKALEAGYQAGLSVVEKGSPGQSSIPGPRSPIPDSHP